MSQQINQVGDFQGVITTYGLVEGKEGSGTVGVSIEVAITAAWNPETKAWDDWSSYDCVSSGVVNIRKKDGTTNDTGVRGLAHAGWNGDLLSIATNQWQPKRISFTVEQDDYRSSKTGSPQFRVGFINAFDAQPGVRGNVTAERARELANMYGSKFRAAVGSLQRNAAPPAGGPKPVIPPGPPPSAFKAANEQARRVGDDSEPF
jgi:hypothetical protein